MPLYKVLIKPLTPLLFRRPGPFEAGLHGPSAQAGSLAYPLPSTIAGFLAGIAFKNGLCEPGEDDVSKSASLDEFSDVRYCLEKLLGENYKLWSGLVEARNGEYYVYKGNPLYLYRLSDLHSHYNLKKEEIRALRVLRASRTGIALKRTDKSVIENMLYTIDKILYRENASITVLVETRENNYKKIKDTIEGVHKFGGKQGIVSVKVKEAKTTIKDLLLPSSTPRGSKEEKEKLNLLLITPALIKIEDMLDENLPVRPPFNKGDPIVSNDREFSKWLGNLLFKEVYNEVRDARVSMIPYGELELGIESLSWCVACSMPRRPYLVIPAGSMVEVSNAPEGFAESIVSRGVGAYTELGWGSALVL